MYENCKEWIFTFGVGMKYGGYCTRVVGDYTEARMKMIDKFGYKWAFQYPANEWEEWKKDPGRSWYMEKELPFDELEEGY